MSDKKSHSKNKKKEEVSTFKKSEKKKLRIKPLIYTMMELRKIKYLLRKDKEIPKELLEKEFEDYELDKETKYIDQITSKKFMNKRKKALKQKKLKEEFEKGNYEALIMENQKKPKDIPLPLPVDDDLNDNNNDKKLE